MTVRPSYLRRVAVMSAIALALGLVSAGTVGHLLSRPAQGPVGSAPAGLNAEDIVLQTVSGERIAGWMIRGAPGRGAVLLLHGVRSNRRQMLPRAKFLNQAGYSVLLIDQQAHGESSGSYISFGIRESEGVQAALQYLVQQFPADKVGVIGVSLGAASFVYSKAPDAPGAVVLESMYSTLAESVANRIEVRLGAIGRYLAPLLLWQLPIRIGVTQQDLRPQDDLPFLKSPVLIVAGDSDRNTTLKETQRLFRVANKPKDLWIVSGAAHVNLHAFNPSVYEKRILSFFARHLK